MAVRVLFVDLRDGKQIMEAHTVQWARELTAELAVKQALDTDVATSIIQDLDEDLWDLTVAWHNAETDAHSGIGGVGDLDWAIPDRSILTIVYENEKTPSDLIDASSEWMLKNSHLP